MSLEILALLVLVLLELYYWFWWLPRNYRETREWKLHADLCERFDCDPETTPTAGQTLYGKQGMVWDLMRKGKL